MMVDLRWCAGLRPGAAVLVAQQGGVFAGFVAGSMAKRFTYPRLAGIIISSAVLSVLRCNAEFARRTAKSRGGNKRGPREAHQMLLRGSPRVSAVLRVNPANRLDRASGASESQAVTAAFRRLRKICEYWPAGQGITTALPQTLAKRLRAERC
jgi:hypothetical protein